MAVLLLLQLPANILGKAEDDLSSWAPYILIETLIKLLVLA